MLTRFKKIISAVGLAALLVAGVGFWPEGKTTHASTSTEMLTSSWHFVMNNGASEKYQSVAANILNGKVSLTLTYNLNGTCIQGGDASYIIFDQNGWKSVSLYNYTPQNCYNGEQVVTIPLSAFSGLNTGANMTGNPPYFHARFWKGSGGPYTVDITSAKLNTPNTAPTVSSLSADPTSATRTQSVSLSAAASDSDGTIASYSWNFGDSSTATSGAGATATASHSYTANGTYTVTLTATDNLGATGTNTVQITVRDATPQWVVQSFDMMKYTKDVVCNPPSDTFIANSVAKAKTNGATHIAISTPYQNVTCGGGTGDSNLLASRWITAARAQGLKIWHRHPNVKFEGIYSQSKVRSPDGYRHIKDITDWIDAHPTWILAGDIFTPEAEPQNGGINGVTSCGSLCQFSSKADFNEWLRMAQLSTKLALRANDIPVTSTWGNTTGVFVGAYGFDGFVTWGDNNGFWQGQSQIEAATVAAMDNVIAIDHYPAAGATMAGDLDEMRAVFPNALVVIGEIGTINDTTDTARVNSVNNWFNAFIARNYILGVNYWHQGPGGNESLINSDFTNKPSGDAVADFYKN